MHRLSVRSIVGSFALAALGLTLIGGAATAQEEGVGFRGWGPTVGMNLGDIDQFTVGLMGDFGTIASPVGLLGFADVGFGDDVTSIIVAPSAVARFPFGDVGELYAGLSLGLAYYSFDVPADVKRAAEQAGFSVDSSSTDFVAALDFGYIYPLQTSSSGIVFDFRIGLVDEHPDFKATMGYGLGIFD